MRTPEKEASLRNLVTSLVAKASKSYRACVRDKKKPTHDLVKNLVPKQKTTHDSKGAGREAKKDEALGSLKTHLTPVAVEAGQRMLRLLRGLQAGPTEPRR